MNPTLQAVTDRIIKRSERTRQAYEERMQKAIAQGPRRGHLSCGNQAHAYAAMGADQTPLIECKEANIGIITAYNDMLSSHQPFHAYPDRIKSVAHNMGATAQVAGGVPAMCDGVTQGQDGMDLSLFSRDVIALSAAVGLSHNTFDGVIYLGMCDKIVPGLIMAAGSFGFLPSVFLPAGPMTSGIPNDEKARIRKDFAEGKIDRAALMEGEIKSYHGHGTCTFYGTANSNQMLMEVMGLHVPGSTFINPGTPLRDALSDFGTRRLLEITALGNNFIPAYEILTVKAFVNGIVGLMATGGSTNLVLHLPAMAATSGITILPEDFDEIAKVVPLLARVYPNGLADVNHFHAAGGLAFVIQELLGSGLLHNDVKTIMGDGLETYCSDAALIDGNLMFRPIEDKIVNDKILRKAQDPFQPTGGLRSLRGNIGSGVMKISAVAPENQIIEAPAKVFHSQNAVKKAFKAGMLNDDCVVVVTHQGPKANGMPELHSLTPTLSVLLDRGYQVALITDGRMSGASGKVPAAIHISPEAAEGGAIGKIQDGDLIRVDAVKGVIENKAQGFSTRSAAQVDQTQDHLGLGRELFEIFRQNATGTALGGSAIVPKEAS